jgi:hypothetical protein
VVCGDLKRGSKRSVALKKTRRAAQKHMKKCKATGRVGCARQAGEPQGEPCRSCRTMKCAAQLDPRMQTSALIGPSTCVLWLQLLVNPHDPLWVLEGKMLVLHFNARAQCRILISSKSQPGPAHTCVCWPAISPAC